MNERAVRAMLRMEVRRAAIIGAKPTVVAVPAALAAWGLGWIGARAVGLVFGVVAMTWVSSTGATFFMDKLNGTMELLGTLPVAARDLAWGRVAACAVLAVPAAVIVTFAAAVAVPWPEVGLPMPRTLAALLPTAWVGSTVVSSLMLGLGMRASPRWALLAVYGTLMAVLYVVAEIFQRLPDVTSMLRTLQESGWLPAALTGTALMVSALLLFVAHALMASAIRRFDPGLDRIEI